MKLNKNLVLVGMMGAGKSSLGQLLAKSLNFEHIDIDNIIENKTKMKISKIFKEKGETYFRNLEEKNTLQVLNENNCVISLGGGGFLNETIRSKIQKTSISIWLDWNHKTLINRIKRNNKRPIALNLSDNKQKNLIIRRSKIYSKADYKINCENTNKNELVKKIIKIYENI
mgnify:CR=1 FL=1